MRTQELFHGLIPTLPDVRRYVFLNRQRNPPRNAEVPPVAGPCVRYAQRPCQKGWKFLEHIFPYFSQNLAIRHICAWVVFSCESTPIRLISSADRSSPVCKHAPNFWRKLLSLFVKLTISTGAHIVHTGRCMYVSRLFARMHIYVFCFLFQIIPDRNTPVLRQ